MVYRKLLLYLNEISYNIKTHLTCPTVKYNTGQADVTVVHITVVSYRIVLPIIATAILLSRDALVNVGSSDAWLTTAYANPCLPTLFYHRQYIFNA